VLEDGFVNVTPVVEFAPALATTPEPALVTVRLWVTGADAVPRLEIAVRVTT
jgi:hypothetical protein